MKYKKLLQDSQSKFRRLEWVSFPGRPGASAGMQSEHGVHIAALPWIGICFSRIFKMLHNLQKLRFCEISENPENPKVSVMLSNSLAFREVWKFREIYTNKWPNRMKIYESRWNFQIDRNLQKWCKGSMRFAKFHRFGKVIVCTMHHVDVCKCM